MPPVASSKPLIAAAAAAVPSNVAPVPDPGDTCKLLPGLFGITIQFLLCATSIAIVFVKYTFESPRRPHKVFLMDFVTMMCGSGTVHILNILSSILINRYKGGAEDTKDECNLYFMTTLFDATFGIYIEYRIVRYLTIRKVAHNYLQLTRKSVFKPKTQELADATRIATDAINGSMNMEIFSEDVEANKPVTHSETTFFDGSEAEQDDLDKQGFWHNFVLMSTSPRAWVKSLGNEDFMDNLTTWLAIVCGLKLFTILVFTIFSSTINKMGHFLLYFLEKRHNLKLLFVMIAAPLVFNIFQYCITDSILKIKAIDHQQMPMTT
ncbi:vacuolar membrane protein ypl162c like protein [Babesia gibsoni]|uniref:Vacuolar membrane protein ypl162c like protein n=1 Tax=Babesia gibsoni TaxID=33632 RepID=A0AAD8LGK4_BABGI|nr:vacuolar membrane protein ypl162c like protein [Babesia gibsoni]